MNRLLGSALIVLLLAGCQKARPAYEVRTQSDPDPATLTLDGRDLGQTPRVISLDRIEDLARIRARYQGQDPVEVRVRFLSGDRAELRFLFGEGRSVMAKALGLARILVFEYSAGLTFDINKAELKDSTHALLDRQAAMLNTAFKDLPVQVCGHTDSTGTQELNLELSLQRAKAVMDYLAGRGVAADRMHPLGFAAAYPLASNATEDGRAQNRRTELVLGM